MAMTYPGELHPKAKLSDHDVELIRTLHEEYHLSYSIIAEKFETSIHTIKDICLFRSRYAPIAGRAAIAQVRISGARRSRRK